MMNILKSLPISFLLFSTTAFSESCPTSYKTPPSETESSVLSQEPKLNNPLIIQALSDKLYTSSQLENFLKSLHWWDGKEISPGTSVGDDNPMMWGCYSTEPHDISGIGCSLIYRERVDVLKKIYECHQRTGWPSAIDSKHKKSSNSAQKEANYAADSVPQKVEGKGKHGRKWVSSIHNQCLTETTVDGMETFNNKCTIPILVSYCIENPDENHQRFKCLSEPSASSPTGESFTKATLEVQPGSSNSVGGLPNTRTQNYYLMACKTDQIPTFSSPGQNGYQALCLINR